MDAVCLVDGINGIYVPQMFAKKCDADAWHYPQEYRELLLRGPAYDWPDEQKKSFCESCNQKNCRSNAVVDECISNEAENAYSYILDNAYFGDGSEKLVLFLNESGDLLAIPEDYFSHNEI